MRINIRDRNKIRGTWSPSFCFGTLFHPEIILLLRDLILKTYSGTIRINKTKMNGEQEGMKEREGKGEKN